MSVSPFELFDDLTVRVRGDCMEPALADRSLVQLQRRRAYLPGDFVAYRNGMAQIVCHRFLGYVLWRNGWQAMTRADNAIEPDALIPLGRLLGKVVAIDHEPLRVPMGARVQAVRSWLQAVGTRLLST